jgi:hypothetical protein
MVLETLAKGASGSEQQLSNQSISNGPENHTMPEDQRARRRVFHDQEHLAGEQIATAACGSPSVWQLGDEHRHALSSIVIRTRSFDLTLPA